jgi:hypothetical protein
LSNKGGQGFDLLTPLVESLSELCQMGAERGIALLTSQIQKSFSKINNPNSMQIDCSMLAETKQVKGEDDLGWSINQKGVYKLRYLSPHLHTFIIGASGWGKSNLLKE